jgi:hypothetical protein
MFLAVFVNRAVIAVQCNDVLPSLLALFSKGVTDEMQFPTAMTVVCSFGPVLSTKTARNINEYLKGF